MYLTRGQLKHLISMSEVRERDKGWVVLDAEDISARLLPEPVDLRTFWRMVRGGRFPQPDIRVTKKVAYWYSLNLVRAGLITPSEEDFEVFSKALRRGEEPMVP